VIDSAYNPADQRFTLLGQDGIIRLVDGEGSQMDALFAHARVDQIGWNVDLAHVTAWSADAIDGVSVTFDRATGRAVSGADQPLDVTQPLAYTRAGSAVAWTPDGGLAAWARPAEAGASAVFVRGETEPLLVLDGDATHAAWSSDGSMLAILDMNRSPTVQVAVNVTHTGIGDLLSLMPPAGGEQVRVAAWSPEGARLAVASADGQVVSLAIYDFDTGAWTRLPELTGGVEAALDWRDDGLLYWSAVGTSPLIIDPTTGTVIRDFDAYAGTVFNDLDRYGIVDWNADETLFAAIENGEPPRLSVINGEGAVVGDYAYGQLTTLAFRWSPAEDALAAFDGGRVILVTP
jgi:WD40 repeat protein